MNFAIGFGIGFVVGWIVFQRPQFATDLLNELWIKIRDVWYRIKMKIWGGN